MGEEQRKSTVIKDYPPLDLSYSPPLVSRYLTLPYLATTTHHRLTESSIAVTLTRPDRLTHQHVTRRLCQPYQRINPSPKTSPFTCQILSRDSLVLMIIINAKPRLLFTCDFLFFSSIQRATWKWKLRHHAGLLLHTRDALHGLEQFMYILSIGNLACIS